MSVSLMLKTEAGKAAGYVLLLENRMLVRIKGQSESGMLVLLSGAGEAARVSVVCDGCEREERYDGPPPTAAYVAIGDALYASTCERARQAYAQREHAGREMRGREEKVASQCKKDGPDRVYKGEEADPAEAPPPFAGRERRWPPPPCWPQARYCSGSWAESGEGG